MRQLQAVPDYPGPLVLAPIGTEPLSALGPLRVVLYKPGMPVFDQDRPTAA